jgi:proteic killer suppression protein
VIVSFADPATEALFHGDRPARFRAIPPDIRPVALRKLDALNAAISLKDLRVPPGNCLEPLAGDLAGFHSIRVNQQWRIVFAWRDGDAHHVRIVDYHRG